MEWSMITLVHFQFSKDMTVPECIDKISRDCHLSLSWPLYRRVYPVHKNSIFFTEIMVNALPKNNENPSEGTVYTVGSRKLFHA